MTAPKRQSHPTQFNRTGPCSDCPFRRDIGGYLMPERAADIADAILHGDSTFTCHKTLGWNQADEADAEADTEEGEEEDWNDGGSSLSITDQSEHCAGALIFSKKHERNVRCANAMLQIAERLGLYDPSRLKEKSFRLVFDTKDEMVEHHSKWLPSSRRRQSDDADENP